MSEPTSIVDEIVAKRITRAIRFCARVLHHVDVAQRTSHIAPVVALRCRHALAAGPASNSALHGKQRLAENFAVGGLASTLCTGMSIAGIWTCPAEWVCD